jgi:Tfp pilus assembly protein FimT
MHMKFRTRQRGQGMTEYIIVVALVAIAAIGVYTAFGKTVRGQMAVTAQALAGNSASQARTEANTGGQNATSQAQRTIQLDNFDQP